jgi:hypothetical protein
VKTWPADAVMVVASFWGQELRGNMESVLEARCRDCGASLAADGYTLKWALSLPSRGDRPVRFFCPECVGNDDANSITELHDHAGVTGRIVP